MKKIVSLLLAVALVMGLGITVFAAGSPTEDGKSGGDGSATTAVPANTGKDFLELYNDDDELIDLVPWEEVTILKVGAANRLSDEEKELFLSTYEDVKKIDDKVVKYFYWLDIPDSYKTEDLAYAKYYFSCTGKNVQLTVNGKDMEVFPSDKGGANNYYAKVTEFGAVAIMCD